MNLREIEHFVSLLGESVVVGTRQSPRFRSGDPRLPALASALLRMPATFSTRDASPLVATLLNRDPKDYRMAHFRYDLSKLRARNMAERIGNTRRYRLTEIGRIVCRTVTARTSLENAPKCQVA